MIQVAVVRHAATEWNAMRRLQGRRDIPLSDKGLAELVHWQLPPLIGDWPVYSSPLQRAQQTARHFGVGGISVDARLIEMDWGNWEGKTLAELRSSDPVGFAAMERRGCDLRPPDGESPRDVQDRLSGFCLELANLGQSSLLVTHRGVIRAFYALATGWNMKNDPPEKIRNDCYHLFSIAPNGVLGLLSLNNPLVQGCNSQSQA